MVTTFENTNLLTSYDVYMPCVMCMYSVVIDTLACLCCNWVGRSHLPRRLVCECATLVQSSLLIVVSVDVQ